MYEKILVPLDGSEVGEAALPYVEGLINKVTPGAKIEITLMHVVSSQANIIVASGDEAGISPIMLPVEEMEQTKKKALAYLDKIGETLKAKGVTVKTLVKVGNAAEEIIATEQEVKADLVAMSTHGRSGISRWTLGSVTDKVLRSGAVPVLTIRARK